MQEQQVENYVHQCYCGKKPSLKREFNNLREKEDFQIICEAECGICGPISKTIKGAVFGWNDAIMTSKNKEKICRPFKCQYYKDSMSNGPCKLYDC